MRCTKMSIATAVGVSALMAALGCCMAAAAPAFAEGGPLWTYCASGCAEGGSGSEVSSLTSAGEALLLLSKELNAQEVSVSVSEYDLSCSVLEGHGYLLGGAPGAGRETITYSGCSLPHKTQCEVSAGGGALGTITTDALEAELVYLTEAAAKGLSETETGTRFKPTSGTTLTTLELHPLAAGACPVTGSAVVKGEVVLENDQLQTIGLSHAVLAPVTAIKKYYSGMTGVANTVKKLELAGLAATYVGDAAEEAAELGGPGVVWWECASKDCIDVPEVLAAPELAEAGELRINDESVDQTFIFTNDGPGAWLPGGGDVVRLVQPPDSEDAFEFTVPAFPCANRIIPQGNQCALGLQLTPRELGEYSLSFEYALAPEVTLRARGV
jgi:hypothetical protein